MAAMMMQLMAAPSMGDEDKENAATTAAVLFGRSAQEHEPTKTTLPPSTNADDLNNNCAKFLNRHKSLDLTCNSHVLLNEQKQSLSSSKLLLAAHTSSMSQEDNDDGNNEAVRVSLALLRPDARNSSSSSSWSSSATDMLDPIHRAISTAKSSGFLSSSSPANNKNSDMDGSGIQTMATTYNDEFVSSNSTPGGQYHQPILESSLTRVHKFLREKNVYSAADYNPKFKRRTVVLIKSKSSSSSSSSSGFAKSTSITNLANMSHHSTAMSSSAALINSHMSNSKSSSSRHGSFGFNLQSYGVLNPATMQVEYICFVSNVQPESSAKKAGLENGDVVLSIDSIQIDEFKSLKEILEHVKNKTELKLVIITENVCKKIKYQQRVEQLKETLKHKYDELEALSAQEVEIMRKYNLDRNQLLRAKLSVFRSFSDASSSLNNNNNNNAGNNSETTGGNSNNMYSSYSESSVNSDEKTVPTQIDDTGARSSKAVLALTVSDSSAHHVSHDDHEVLLQHVKRGSLMSVKGSRSSSHRTSLNFTSSCSSNTNAAVQQNPSPSPSVSTAKPFFHNVKSSSGFKLLPNSFSKLNSSYKVAATTTAANTSKINNSHNNKSQSSLLTINTNTSHSLNHPIIPTLSSGSTSTYFASPEPAAMLDGQGAPEAATVIGHQSASSSNSKAKSFAKKFIFSNRIVRSASSSSMNLLSNLKFANSDKKASSSSSSAKKQPLFSPLCSTVVQDDNPSSTAQLHHPLVDKPEEVNNERVVVLDSVIGDRLSYLEKEPHRSKNNSSSPTSPRSSTKMFAPVKQLVVESDSSFEKKIAAAATTAPLAGAEHDSACNSLEHEAAKDQVATTATASSSRCPVQMNNSEESSPPLEAESASTDDHDKSFKSVVAVDNDVLLLGNSSQGLNSSSASTKYKSLLVSSDDSSSSLLYFSPNSRDLSEVYINLNIDSTHNNNESNDDSCFLDPHPHDADNSNSKPAALTSTTEQEPDEPGEISNKLALLTTRNNSFNYSSSTSTANKDSLSSSSTSTISTFSNNSSSSSATSNAGQQVSNDDPPQKMVPPDNGEGELFPLPIRPGALVNKRDQDYIVTRL